jgi:glycosyltransferase involved in cell wall biosynthesis
MKIGIGITTRNRSKLLEITLSNICKYWPDFDVKFVVSDDSTEESVIALNKQLADNFGAEYLNDYQRKGVAGNKNQCLNALRDCDYLFLFDDDCFPIQQGWCEFLINAHKETGIHHFNLLDSSLHCELRRKQVGDFCVIECGNSGGVMMFITQEVVRKVGAFNKNYGLYGFEHCSYSKRVELSGLQNGFTGNTTLHNLHSYLFSVDYSQFAVNPNHELFKLTFPDESDRTILLSSMNRNEIQASISNNTSIYYSDISGPIFQEL